ncbi:hypothetical protein VP01_48g4 [Puccinia sorghi]|uniref:Uncharacterized protein n=1 Tax=Puccinia sorghi TaxID=27349 RepID=A0A0L6UM57_9BASI|nr:hypothetical protein VP01_48g4 [Puccinia sorghi]
MAEDVDTASIRWWLSLLIAWRPLSINPQYFTHPCHCPIKNTKLPDCLKTQIEFFKQALCTSKSGFMYVFNKLSSQKLSLTIERLCSTGNTAFDRKFSCHLNFGFRKVLKITCCVIEALISLGRT